MDVLNGYPVFYFLVNEPGTTLVHYTLDEIKTLCGISCINWYGDDDLSFKDVECKRCRKAGDALIKEKEII